MTEPETPVSRESGVQTDVPSEWRKTLAAIVDSLSQPDASVVPGVESVSTDQSERLHQTVVKYGEPLVPLPDASWLTSVAMYQGGFWECLVDLWSSEGRTDLVLHVEVKESESGGYRFRVHDVYVP